MVGPKLCSNYTNNPEGMPCDSHFMGAMYAPRGILILDNPYIGHLGPIGGHVAAKATAEIYKALGFEKNVYYFSAGGNGTHCQFQSESGDMLRSAIRAFLTRTEEPDGGMMIHDSFDASRQSAMYGNLSDWADWDTPTLD